MVDYVYHRNNIGNHQILRPYLFLLYKRNRTPDTRSVTLKCTVKTTRYFIPTTIVVADVYWEMKSSAQCSLFQTTLQSVRQLEDIFHLE